MSTNWQTAINFPYTILPLVLEWKIMESYWKWTVNLSSLSVKNNNSSHLLSRFFTYRRIYRRYESHTGQDIMANFQWPRLLKQFPVISLYNWLIEVFNVKGLFWWWLGQTVKKRFFDGLTSPILKSTPWKPSSDTNGPGLNLLGETLT